MVPGPANVNRLFLHKRQCGHIHHPSARLVVCERRALQRMPHAVSTAVGTYTPPRGRVPETIVKRRPEHLQRRLGTQ